MTTLFIDTHLNDIIVALLKDGKIVDKKEVINKKNNSELLFPTIKEVIDNENLNEIIVINGPGSFTGVRLGVTIAKTLAYTLNISIKPINALKAMAISNNKKMVAISDNNGYYLGVFDENFKEKEEYRYVDNEEFLKVQDKYFTEYILNIEKIYEYMNNEESINPHEVNPIYIKKIGVEIDKKSN